MTSSQPPDVERRAAPRRIIVAIDGPAASGKSSTATWVAEELGFKHVDSGSLYRAVTAARLREDGGNPSAGEQNSGKTRLGAAERAQRWSAESVLASARRCSLISAPGPSFLPAIDSVPAEEEIRAAGVTQCVSAVARLAPVRLWVNDRVREIARHYDVVVDGRDIGTAVFPDAQLKVFLVADPWERARRRLRQQLDRGPTDEEIAAETERLVQRDARDATQTVQAKDAVLIDTTYITQREQVERIVALVRAVTQRGGNTSEIDLS